MSAAAVLTPERVAALTDIQLSEAVAREVFGARIVDEWPDDERPNPLLALRHAEGITVGLPGGGCGNLAPSSAAAVLRVLEHTRQRWAVTAKAECALGELRFWSIESDDGGWSVSVRGYEDEILAASEHFDDDPSLGRQVFECALLACTGGAR